jgi:aspartate dehydrogenase
MTSTKDRRKKVGIVGCGAVGSRMAQSIQDDLKDVCRLTGLLDIDGEKARQLARKFGLPQTVKRSIGGLIKSCDCMVEAVNAQSTYELIRRALSSGKSVLSMSVGGLLNAGDLFRLAHQKGCHLLVPSGAIAGMDAVKAASLAGIDQINLTTRKPPIGFVDNPYLKSKGIDPSHIRKETVLFDGDVASAVKNFPQNINVAATLALASQCRDKLTVRIITSPEYKTNSHTVELTGPFGRIVTQTENVVCPDNPKTSYLAVLSGVQTLKQYCMGVFIGT